MSSRRHKRNSPPFDLKAIEAAAVEHNCLPLAILANNVRDAAGTPCLRCGQPSDAVAFFTLTREMCRATGYEYGPGPTGPGCTVGLCRCCDAIIGRDPKAAKEMEGRAIWLINNGHVNVTGVGRAKDFEP